MILDHCEISLTPGYQAVVSDLISMDPQLSTQADREVYRDYMEYGTLRGASEIFNKLRGDFFTPYGSTPAAEKPVRTTGENEIIMPRVSKFKELGYKGSLKKTISEENISILKGRISRLNNDLFKKGVDRVYTLEDVKQVGQSDNFTYEVKVYRGRLNIDEKIDRLKEFDLERNRPRLITAGTVTAKEIAERYDNNMRDVANYSQEIIRKMADAMVQQVGIEYSFVTGEQAKEITKNAPNPWDGQKSFFYGGRVYFIEGFLSPSDVLHEFVHPIIKSIGKANAPLFNSLFDKLASTEEGRKILEQVRELYPDLNESSDDFKEEVLVRGIESKRNLNAQGLESSTAFEKFVNDLLYAIKQFLRKIFGSKVTVSNLDVDTTLDELSDMLKEGAVFELDEEVVTDRDLVAYKNDYRSFAQDIVAEKIDKKEIEDLTNKYFENVKKYIANARKEENLGELARLIYTSDRLSEFEKITKNLKSYQTQILQDSKQMDDEVELTRQRVQAVVNSLSNLDNTISKILEAFPDIVKDINDRDNIQRVQYFQRFLNYWGDFAKSARTILERNGVKVKFVDNLNANVDRANALVEDFYEKASKQTITEVLNNTAQAIDRKWQERIATLKNRGASQEEINRAVADSKKEALTPDIIEQALKGQLKDIGFLTAYLEAAGYNPDPIVGGLALFVKNGINEAEARVQSRFNTAVQEIKPLLDRVGYNPNKPGEIGEKLGKKEMVGQVNPETGEFEEKEVWVLKNQFTGARIARERRLFNLTKAREKFQQTGSEVDRKELAALQAEHEQHDRDYFHTQYTEAYYKAYDILGRDEVGQEANLRIRDLYDELNLLVGEMYRAGSEDALHIADLIEAKRREIRQVSSLYDLAGDMKTGRDLEIAERLQRFNEKAKDIYESQEIPGAFQEAYKQYEQKLRDEGKGPEEVQMGMRRWLEKNTRVSVKEAFWTKMDQVNAAIQEILSSLPDQSDLAAEIDEAYKVLRDLTKGKRDEGGQPVGAEMSPERQQKIKDAQEKINAARDKMSNQSGLPKHERDQIQAILAKITRGAKLTPQESLTLSRLLQKQSSLRLSKIQRAELNSLFAELDELRSREPTDSYIDSVNSLLAGISDQDSVYDILGTLSIDKDTAYLLRSDEIVNRLMDLSKDFEAWYMRNHTSREVVDWETTETEIVWDSTYAWKVIRPNDKKYYDTTKVENLSGETVEIDGLPSMRYFKRVVKDEYLTKEIPGVTKDNRGYWLPKTTAQGAKDDRYIDKEYERLKASNSDEFKLLEAVTRNHLKNQEGLHRKNKLWLEFPRYRKGFAERLQSENVFQRLIQRIKDFFTTVKDSWDQGFNFDTNYQLIKMDLFDTDVNNVPTSGLSDLAIEEVSTDLIFTMFKYGYSAERNRTLSNMAPVARMIQNVVNNVKNQPFEEKILNNSTLVYPNRKKKRYLRARAVNNFIEKNFEGVENVGWGSESAFAQNFSNALFRSASGAFLNLNIPSAVKNMLSMKYQSLIEAIAGRYLTPGDLFAAEGWATATAMKISSEIYKQDVKSLDVQIVELFDPERDRFRYGFGESITRTPTKDYSYDILHRMTDMRKWMQLQAGLQTFWAMMKHQMVTTKEGKQAPYTDVWEVKNGKIQVKDNIDPSWGITYDKDGDPIVGEKFIQKRNEIHRVLENLNGAVSRESRPEADRYLAFRYVSFFRRFLTAMLMNRFAKNRYDFQLGMRKEGWYRTFLKLVANSFRSGFRNLPFMTPEEKAAAMRMTTELGLATIIKFLIVPLIFGFDDDDEDRYKKLRAKSGPLPFPGVYDDPFRPFELGGWFENHLLLNLLQTTNENDMFIPWPGYGLSEYRQMLDVKSLVFGPTLRAGFQVVDDVSNMVTGDDSAYYKRTVGPYNWQQEDALKIWAHLAKIIGLTGSTIDPATAVKNFESAQNR